MKRAILFIILALFNICCLKSQSVSSEYNEVDQAKFIIITKNSLLLKDQDKDAALLISDKANIDKITTLFKGNKNLGHACSYHWTIWFWISPDRVIRAEFNEECEEFVQNSFWIHRALSPHFETIKNNPSHFILNFEIPIEHELDYLVKNIDSQDGLILPMVDRNKALPQLKINANTISDIPADRNQWEKAKNDNEKKCLAILENNINSLKQKYPVKDFSKPNRFRSLFGGNKIDDTCESTIYFQIGTNLTNIEKELIDVTVIEKKESGSYIVQLISKNRFSEAYQQQLMEKYKFVKTISKFRADN